MKNNIHVFSCWSKADELASYYVNSFASQQIDPNSSFLLLLVKPTVPEPLTGY